MATLGSADTELSGQGVEFGFSLAGGGCWQALGRDVTHIDRRFEEASGCCREGSVADRSGREGHRAPAAVYARGGAGVNGVVAVVLGRSGDIPDVFKVEVRTD